MGTYERDTAVASAHLSLHGSGNGRPGATWPSLRQARGPQVLYARLYMLVSHRDWLGLQHSWQSPWRQTTCCHTSRLKVAWQQQKEQRWQQSTAFCEQPCFSWWMSSFTEVSTTKYKDLIWRRIIYLVCDPGLFGGGAKLTLQKRLTTKH